MACPCETIRKSRYWRNNVLENLASETEYAKT